MVRRVFVAVVCVCAVAAYAWEGPPPPEIEGALRSGLYEISNLRVSGAPDSKQNGSAWDPFGGLPDLQVTIHTVSESGEYEAESTRHIENSGTAASWPETLMFRISGPEEFSGPEVEKLVFKVWDSDTYDPDFVDSGEILTSEVSTDETNTVRCNFGTIIEFDIEWVGMQ